MKNVDLKDMEKFKGVIVPMITPFTKELDIDQEATRRIVDNLVKNDCAVFILGTTGEALSVSHQKKYDLAKAAVRSANGRKIVYAGISGNCFDESVENAKRFQEMGVDAVVAHLPAFYPLSGDHMLHYFEALADAVPLPLILYNMPATTHHSLSIEIIDQLSHHDNIIGLKDSERGEERLDKSLEKWKDREDFVFHLGWAAKSSYGVRNGLDGIVPSTGNLVPGLYSELFSAAKRNDFSKAEELQEITNEISSYYQAGNLLSEAIPRLKGMMKTFGLCTNKVEFPMIQISDELQEKIDTEVLQKYSKYNTSK
ncbi:dihydrodipicolinate synthase family protein [Autumnicola musiva]|uniref:Dihydrodipicolinate synthase family protein n=1 Tax=Autumnicola musiva TaxID=3075589 RepID=A0ABU3D8B4_9FLAO|nr:dihydrodipicolinate synthase family protein [Zunongwangia sp. F117]MDT0677614.1 dihydrodipicolinate synthase family protein [Zunongwangia sp. F117]